VGLESKKKMLSWYKRIETPTRATRENMEKLEREIKEEEPNFDFETWLTEKDGIEELHL
jgi:hypothetical protein